MNFHRFLRPDSDSWVPTTGLRLETPVYRPSTRAPRRPFPWDQPVCVVILFLGRHSAHENRRLDRQLRDAIENGREPVSCDRHLGQLKEHVLRVTRPLAPILISLSRQVVSASSKAYLYVATNCPSASNRCRFVKSLSCCSAEGAVTRMPSSTRLSREGPSGCRREDRGRHRHTVG